MSVDLSCMALGKHRGVVIDPRTLRASKYIDRSELPPLPKASSVTNKVAVWPLFRNDEIGDCTCVGQAHGLIARSTREGHPIHLTDQDVVGVYSAVTGYPGTGDNGAYMLDVLNFMRKEGMAGHRIGAFAKLDLRDWASFRYAQWLFGGVYLGLALPVSAQRQSRWRVVGDGKAGDAAPGSWGGHAVEVLWSTDNTATCVTWGMKMKMDKEFVQAYADEGYVVISPEWLDPKSGRSPQGLRIEQLTRDLGAIT